MYLTVQEVAERYKVKTPTIWRWCKADTFPKPVKINERTTRWLLSEVEAHDAKCLEAVK